jgi:adenylylsulfate kinase
MERPTKPFVLWFTGLPSSGKSTLADRIAQYLASLGVAAERLDGDQVRAVFPATGFSREERNLHVKRIGFLASRLEAHGVTVIASFVSPYREGRDFVRNNCKNFVEVYIATPAPECERRDRKGLYKKARAGILANFTGVNDPYEPPVSPELKIDTSGKAEDECVELIKHYLLSKGLVNCS